MPKHCVTPVTQTTAANLFVVLSHHKTGIHSTFLSCMLHLLRKVGFIPLPFKPISRNPHTAKPITEETHHSSHVSLLWLVVFRSVQRSISSSDQTVKLGSADQIWIKILLLHCLFLPQMFQKHIVVTVSCNLRLFVNRQPCFSAYKRTQHRPNLHVPLTVTQRQCVAVHNFPCK